MTSEPNTPAGPQLALADALGGSIVGSSGAIQVGAHMITAGPTGVVRVDGKVIGAWNNGTEILADAFREAVA